MSTDPSRKAHRFLSLFVDWKKVATALLLGGVTVIYSGAGWVWHQFTQHQDQIQTLEHELQTYKAHVLPEQQELVRRNLQLEQQLQGLVLEYRMLRYQVEWQHRKASPNPGASRGPASVNPEDPTPTPTPTPAAWPSDFAEWWEKYRVTSGAHTISPEDIKRFREQAQQMPSIPYGSGK
jgi:hypothetical protein